MYNRQIKVKILSALNRGKSILLLGARQTGKTTLLENLDSNLFVRLANPVTRLKYENNLQLLQGEIEALSENTLKMPLIFIDEVQKIPLIMDLVQDLIDRKIAQFILTGSSARKLKKAGEINLLPGRVVAFRMDPLSISELTKKKSLTERLLDGTLPGIIQLTENEAKDEDLQAYASLYIEDEIRTEALVRNVAHFSAFLNLAASEAGNIINMAKLSQEIGVAHTTIADYYQILEDCMIAEKIRPLSAVRTKRKLIKSSQYLFFDLGLKRACANEGRQPPIEHISKLFEQYIGLEILRYRNQNNKQYELNFWRDFSGIEVDWIINSKEKLIPIEVKWTDSPKDKHIKHLKLFLKEHETAKKGYLICQTTRRAKLSENIYAIPWQELPALIAEECE